MHKLQDVIQHFQMYATNKDLANALGVHVNTIMNYSSGKSPTCANSVLDALYDNFKIGGNPVVIEWFESESHYKELRCLRDKAFKEAMKVAPERAESV